jgi:selenocysteine-specific elongation factor
VSRGAVLVDIGRWHRTRRFDAEIEVLAGRAVSGRGGLFAYGGTAEQPIRMQPLQGTELRGATIGAARCWLGTALPLVPGDRFVVRDAGTATTVGGGVVLDVDPVLPVSRAAPSLSVDRVVAEHGIIDADRLEVLTGQHRPPTHGPWILSPGFASHTADLLRAAVARSGPSGLEIATLTDAERAVLRSVDDLVVGGGRVHRPGTDDGLADHPWLLALRQSPFAPPDPGDTPSREVRQLKQAGLVVEHDGIHFATGSLETARQRLMSALTDLPDGITISQLRALLGTSRKYAIPIANAFDGRGITRRRGDRRVAGPRAHDPFTAHPI